jgi:hypothetical protein
MENHFELIQVKQACKHGLQINLNLSNKKDNGEINTEKHIGKI